MRKLLILFLLMLVPIIAQAEQVIRVYAGANGVWLDDNVRPSDFEAGGNVSASLSPHIALVGSAYYGFDNSYLRGSAGARVTATDVDDPNFSIGVGIAYHASSEPSIRSEGWGPDVSIGYRAWPERWPAVVLIGQATYLMEPNEAMLIAGVRYNLGLGR